MGWKMIKPMDKLSKARWVQECWDPNVSDGFDEWKVLVGESGQLGKKGLAWGICLESSLQTFWKGKWALCRLLLNFLVHLMQLGSGS